MLLLHNSISNKANKSLQPTARFALAQGASAEIVIRPLNEQVFYMRMLEKREIEEIGDRPCFLHESHAACDETI